MKIVVVTFDEPFFIPDLFRPMMEKFSKDVKAVIVVPPKHPKKSQIKFVLEQLTLTSFPTFLLKSAIYAKEISYLRLGLSNRFLSKIAQEKNIKVFTSNSVNSKKTSDLLKSIKPDIVITQVPEIIDESILELAKKGFINKHASLLPKYKGLYPIFWALLKGEKNIGYTFHLMNNQIDSGDILFQRVIKVSKEDSLSELYQKVFKLAGKDLPGIVEDFDKKRLRLRKMSKIRNNYFSLPEKKDIKKFKKLGYKLN